MMSSTRKRGDGVVPLINQGTDLWYGEIDVGTPKQKFNGQTILLSAWNEHPLLIELYPQYPSTREARTFVSTYT